MRRNAEPDMETLLEMPQVNTVKPGKKDAHGIYFFVGQRDDLLDAGAYRQRFFDTDYDCGINIGGLWRSLALCRGHYDLHANISPYRDCRADRFGGQHLGRKCRLEKSYHAGASLLDFPDVPLLTALEHSYSFPSGHTFSSFAAATAIAIGNRRWAIAAMGTAALIGFSRVYLFMHYPSDVLGGALLGIAFGALAWKYSGRLCRAWQTEDYKD